MRKKVIFYLLILTSVFLIDISKANSEEVNIFEYGTTNPIVYQDGTNTPVPIPDSYVPKKQELRGVWVATVENLDISKQSGTTQTAITNYKNEFLSILDTLEDYNMNAIIFQVRPANDAFYQSTLNPWSRYLMGTEGVNPGWDPLAWMVEESHKRGIEFHAWMNPYRVKISGASNDNFAKLHPEYFVSTAGILNPGEPAVQQFIVDTVMEVVENYDIDAIHFDDYFYPYGGFDDALDSDQFNSYNPSSLSKEDWRRENINTVIRNIKTSISSHNQTNNKAVQFGISPFGIWANRSSNPLGSDTLGSQSYYQQYADTRKWVKEGWVDYICPQIYWGFEKTVAPYADLVKWWSDVVSDTNVNLYIGQAFYKAGGYSDFMNPDEIMHQLLYNQKYEEVKGTVVFRYKNLIGSGNTPLYSFRDDIKTSYNSSVSILPAQKNIDNIAPIKPSNIVITEINEGIKLQWNGTSDHRFYAVYRFEENETINIDNSYKVLDLVYPTTSQQIEYIDTSIDSNTTYQYVVTAFDNAYNESDMLLGSNNPVILGPSFENVENFEVDVFSSKPNYLASITAIDGLGNDITSSISYDDSLVNLDKVGEYNLVYSVTDSLNKTSTTTVKVKVVDDVYPIINNAEDIYVALDATNVDYLDGVTATDNYDGDLTSEIIPMDTFVKLDKLGIYVLTYYVTDSSGNRTTERVNVIVEDRTKPIINGTHDIYVNIDSQTPNYLEGIYVIDNVDGDITNNISINDSDVDLTTRGIYTVIYSITDSSGNKEETNIKVYVGDVEKPIIEGVKDLEITDIKNIDFLLGVTANDLQDGDLTDEIKVDDSKVNIDKSGVYKITYIVTDSDGNSTEVTANVKIVNNDLHVSEEVKYIFIFSGVLFLFFAAISKLSKRK